MRWHFVRVLAPYLGPDWTSEACRKRLITMMLKEVRGNVGRDIGRQTPDFRASGYSNVHYDIRNNSGVITLVGISIGTVSALSQIQDNTWNKEDLIANWRPITERIGEEYLNGESSELAYARTICTNQLNLEDEDPVELGRGWFVATMGRKFMLSDKGHIGLVPADKREGDIVSVLKGGKTPFVLRPEDNHFLMVGEAYGGYLLSHSQVFILC